MRKLSIKVGDKVYWVDLAGRIIEGTIIKVSKWRRKAWIKFSENDVREATFYSIGRRYFLSKEDAVKNVIKYLEVEIEHMKWCCSRLPELEKELEKWKKKLKSIQKGGEK